MQLRVAFLIWLGFFIGFCTIAFICSATGLSQFITFIYYIVAGFYLSRIVLANLIDWHPMYNTIDNVSSAKLGFALLWIIRYPILFFKLGILKVL